MNLLKEVKTLDKETRESINWLSAEFKFLKRLDNLISQLYLKDKLSEERKAYRKAKRALRYVKRSEGKAEKHILHLKDKIKEFPFLQAIGNNLEISEAQLVKAFSFYTGEFKDELVQVITGLDEKKKVARQLKIATFLSKDQKEIAALDRKVVLASTELKKVVQEVENKVNTLIRWVESLVALLKQVRKEEGKLVQVFSGAMTRRRAMVLVAQGLIAASLVPNVADGKERIFFPYKKTGTQYGAVSTMAEFTEKCIKESLLSKREKITILYPGSFSDLTPFEIGLQFLHKTKVKEIHYIYTELDGFKKITWIENFSNFKSRLDAELNILLKKGTIKSKSSKIKTNNRWGHKMKNSSRVIDYDISVPIGKTVKKIYLTVGFNIFIDRLEPTLVERKIFSSSFIKNAREHYWPLKKDPKKIYPTYFIQPQFDEADILLNKMCGDGRLLLFDYARAFNNTLKKKERVMLLELADRSKKDLVPNVINHSFKMHYLTNKDYGYCHYGSKSCKIGFLVAKPK